MSGHLTQPRSSTRPLNVRSAALLAALALGVLGDVLLKTPGPPALNGFLLALAGVLALTELSGRRELRTSGEAAALVGLGLLFAAGLVFRDAESARVLNILAAATAVSLAALRSSEAWVRRAGVQDYLKAGAVMAGNFVAGPAALVQWRRDAEVVVDEASGRGWRVARGVLKGTALALPALLLLGGLLMSADPVFARLITDYVSFDIEYVIEHAFFVGFFTWVSAGYLRGFLIGPALPTLTPAVTRPRLSTLEVSVVLGILNVLFLLFVGVQLTTLFGGAALVEVTPGLTYADYAREGFFQLLAVAALVIPLLLLTDWLHEDRTRDNQLLVRGLSLLLVSLLFVVIASAFRRLGLYLSNYGLTESRILAGSAMGWLTIVLGWLAATVLRGQRPRFAFGALVTGFAVIAALNVVNLEALIVRGNLAAAAEGQRFDVYYAANMSADGVPSVVRALPGMEPGDRCFVAGRLQQRWGGVRRGGWKTWSLPDGKARRAVEAGVDMEGWGCPDEVGSR